jgi:hypothetical protein
MLMECAFARCNSYRKLMAMILAAFVLPAMAWPQLVPGSINAHWNEGAVNCAAASGSWFVTCNGARVGAPSRCRLYAIGLTRARNCFHFPMQNLLKIKLRMSSFVVAPVISSRGRSAL